MSDQLDNNLTSCRCGHDFNEHIPFAPPGNTFEEKFCECGCTDYRRDNLKYLEGQKYGKNH